MTRHISRSRLLPYTITDYMFDGADTARQRVSFADELIQHQATAAGDAQRRDARSLGRVYSVQLVSSAPVVTTALIGQVKVNGRPLFEDALRPTIAVGATLSAVVRVGDKRRYIRGEPITSVIDQVDALQTGSLTAIIKQEPFTLDPRDEVAAPTARSRFDRSAVRVTYLPQPPKARDLVARPAGLRQASSRIAPRRSVTTQTAPLPGPNTSKGRNNPLTYNPSVNWAWWKRILGL